MNKTELIARIAEVSGLTAKDADIALESTLVQTETALSGVGMVKTGEYDFVNSNRPRRKKGKIKKNWE